MSKHVPILLNTIVENLLADWERRTSGFTPITENLWIVDCTLGGGGHTRALLDALAEKKINAKVLGVDRDKQAIEKARVTFVKEIEAGTLVLLQSRFGELSDFFKSHSILGVLADLGFSSDQIEDPARGLSFKSEGPLDFRLGPDEAIPTAWDWLQTMTEDELTKILSEFGEERFSKSIARGVKFAIKKGELQNSTTSLVATIVRSIPPKFRHGRIHAATRSFQALRILVNQEFEELDSLLSRAIIQLRRGARFAILTFHSGEDRRVKHWIRSQKDVFESLSRKPLLPSSDEVEANPRARSAKLRMAEKVS